MSYHDMVALITDIGKNFLGWNYYFSNKHRIQAYIVRADGTYTKMKDINVTLDTILAAERSGLIKEVHWNTKYLKHQSIAWYYKVVNNG